MVKVLEGGLLALYVAAVLEEIDIWLHSSLYHFEMKAVRFTKVHSADRYIGQECVK